MKLYLIDPKTRTVKEVEYEPRDIYDPGSVAEYFPYEAGLADFKTILCGEKFDILVKLDKIVSDVPVLGDLMTRQEKAWGYHCHGCNKIHSIVGVSLIVGHDMEGDRHILCSPHHSLEAVKRWVKWANLLELTQEESDIYRKTGKVPEAARDRATKTFGAPQIGEEETPSNEWIDPSATVAAAMEMARISTKH